MSTEGLRAFAHEVRAYCQWCERPEPNETEYAAARAALRFVGMLQQLALPLDFPEDPPVIDADRPSQDEWQAVCRRFKSMPFSYYNGFFDPHENVGVTSEAGVDDLLDDLADIWRDLRHGLDLWDAGEEAAAQWEWVFGYRSHWGRHAAGAQYALHCWMADYGGWLDPNAIEDADD